MRKLHIITTAMCLLMASCVSSRKTSENLSVHTQDSVSVSVQTHSSTETFVSEIQDQNITVVVTEIEFNEPACVTDSSHKEIVIRPNGEVSGNTDNVKSIRQTTYTSQASQQSEIQNSTTADTTATVAAASEAEIVEESHTERKSNSMRGTIIILAAMLSACFLYLKRKPIKQFLKRILIGFVKTITRS